MKCLIYSVLTAVIMLSSSAFAADGQTIECEGRNFKVSGVLDSKKMNLDVSDARGILVEEGKTETMEFDVSTTYDSDFGSGLTFDAWTYTHMLVINFPKRVFSRNVRKDFKAELVTYFEGFNPTYLEFITCSAK